MANVRVLLADSDSSFRTIAQRALTRQGYLVIPADSGAGALSLVESENVDLVVTDVGEPQFDGLEVLQAAKAKFPSLPVILLAEPDSIESAKSGVTQGAAGYVAKPVDDLSALVDLVGKVSSDLPPRSSERAGYEPLARTVDPGDLADRFLEAVAAGRDLDHLLSLYLEEMAQLASASQAVVLLSHSDGQLHLTAVHGFTDRTEAGRAFVKAGGEEFAYQVAAASGLIDETARPPDEAQDGIAARELIGLPLVYAHDVLGTAIIFSKSPVSMLSDSTAADMHRLTQQAALAVELSLVRGLADRRNPTDAVTGLYNREHFFELAEREFRRSWRFGERIAAIQLDVDEFGKLSSLVGSNEGDELIRQVARAVHTHVRNIDVVGRLDADKFGVLVLNAHKEYGMEVAERLRREVAEIEVPTSEGTWQVTASLGVATYPREQCASVHDLFGLSAQATRAAKRAGHNRVVGV